MPSPRHCVRTGVARKRSVHHGRAAPWLGLTDGPADWTGRLARARAGLMRMLDLLGDTPAPVVSDLGMPVG